MKIDELGYPMMAKHEVEYIRNLINDLKCQTCLEWGSGNSTVYFPNECKSIHQWVSIEHDGHYVEYLRDRVNKLKVVNVWVQNNEWYIDCVKHNGHKYDFILVDGMNREGCLKEAFNLVKERTGVILLHDSDREEYQVFINKYPHEVIFKGEKELNNGFSAHRGLTLFRP